MGDECWYIWNSILWRYNLGLILREIIFLIKRTCHNTSGLSAIIAGLGWVEANDEDCTEDGDAYSDPESGNHKF